MAVRNVKKSKKGKKSSSVPKRSSSRKSSNSRSRKLLTDGVSFGESRSLVKFKKYIELAEARHARALDDDSGGGFSTKNHLRLMMMISVFSVSLFLFSVLLVSSGMEELGFLDTNLFTGSSISDIGLSGGFSTVLSWFLLVGLGVLGVMFVYNKTGSWNPFAKKGKALKKAVKKGKKVKAVKAKPVKKVKSAKPVKKGDGFFAKLFSKKSKGKSKAVAKGKAKKEVKLKMKLSKPPAPKGLAKKKAEKFKKEKLNPKVYPETFHPKWDFFLDYAHALGLGRFKLLKYKLYKDPVNVMQKFMNNLPSFHDDLGYETGKKLDVKLVKLCKDIPPKERSRLTPMVNVIKKFDRGKLK